MENDISELFWNASVEELKRGYVYRERDEAYLCLADGERFFKGIIYPHEGVLYEAEKYVQLHIRTKYGSMLAYLLGLDKKLTGLTDLQKNLIERFNRGQSDNEIVKELEAGSASTIRNHRFALRERTKQAKVFLSIMELAEEKIDHASRFVPIHRTATMLDERYAITEKENAEVLKTFFKEGLEGPLSEFPKKEKRKIAILRHLVKSFEPGKRYTEKEVNAILQQRFADYVTLRRYFIEYGFMDREPDGSQYWVKEEQKKGELNVMDKQQRKEIGDAYAHSFRRMGIYQIRELVSGKVWMASSMDIDGAFNKDRFMLDFGNHNVSELQADWNRLGASAFAFEVVDELKPQEAYLENVQELAKYKQELKALNELWLDKLQPYGDRGYNKPRRS